MTDQSLPADTPTTPTGPRPPWLRWLWTVAPGLALLGGLAYGTAMAVIDTIDDAADFGPGKVAEGESRAVAMAAQLVFRETETHRWVANDPFFQPSWALDNMPAYQQGIIAAVARFASETSQMTVRAGAPDINLERAVGFLKYPGNIWMFDLSRSWAPTASSEKQYRSAARNLVLYNEQLAAGTAVFDRRPEALAAMLAHVGADLDAQAAALESHLAEGRAALFDAEADDLFYATKGRLYGHSLLLRELGADFAPLLGQHELAAAWTGLLDSLRRAAGLAPLVVLNGAADGILLPSHLAAQGFHLLRARSQLAAIAARLQPKPS